MDRRPGVEGVVRALRRVNFQGSIFGQSVAIRLGLSESDIDALELLIDTGAATAGKLSEVMGMTTGAVTRVIDRLEQAGYVRRTTDPADRRRVVVEVVPERVATVQSLLESLERACAEEVGRYSPEQLALINDFLSRMADLTQTEAARLRTSPEGDPSEPTGPAEHAAPLGGLTVGPPDVPLGRPGSPAPDGPLAARPLPGPVRWRDPAGPGPRRSRPRPVPRDPVRLAQARRDDRAEHLDPVDDRGRRRHEPDRGRPARGRRPPFRADRRQRPDPARIRASGRRRADPDRRRLADDPPRTPGRHTGPPAIQGSASAVGLDGAAYGKKGGDGAVESRGWSGGDATGSAVEVVGSSRSIDIVERRA